MIELLFALREFCLDAVKELGLKSKDRGDLPAIKGFIGDTPGESELPPASDFPVLIFRLVSFNDSGGERALLTVRILAGVYNPDDNSDDICSPGYHDLLNILKRLRQALLKQCNINGRWRRVGEVEGGPFEYQAYPYCFGDIIVQYQEIQTQEEFDVEEAINTYGTAYGNDNTGDWVSPGRRGR